MSNKLDELKKTLEEIGYSVVSKKNHLLVRGTYSCSQRTSKKAANRS